MFETAAYELTTPSHEKWMLGLLSPHERAALTRAETHSAVSNFSDVAKVEVGMVTGANDFFLVSDAVLKSYELDEFELPMIGRSQHLPGVVYTADRHKANKAKGLPVNFVDFSRDSIEVASSRAKEYILSGEALGLHLRYKTGIRDPWYEVPSKWAPQLFLLKRSHNVPKLVVNDIGALNTDTAYRVTSEIESKSLAFSFYNSLTAISAELRGRSYGGGVLELVPSEIRRLLVPIVSPTTSQFEELDRMLASGTPNSHILAIQDQIILTAVGISVQDIRVIQKARETLQSRRFREVPIE